VSSSPFLPNVQGNLYSCGKSKGFAPDNSKNHAFFSQLLEQHSRFL